MNTTKCNPVIGWFSFEGSRFHKNVRVDERGERVHILLSGWSAECQGDRCAQDGPMLALPHSRIIHALSGF